MAPSLSRPAAHLPIAREKARRQPRAKPVLLVLGAGLIAGTLDIADCIAFNAVRSVTPAMIFRYIASGLIGVRAARPGLAPVALGVLLHYLIAFTWTALFYQASRKLKILTRRPVVSGSLYGAFVFLFMNAIVLPLSGLPPGWAGATPIGIINSVLAVVLCVGLTISLLVWRFSGTELDGRA
jgi:hypothetical protein